jgi:hypothetical protein
MSLPEVRAPASRRGISALRARDYNAVLGEFNGGKIRGDFCPRFYRIVSRFAAKLIDESVATFLD